jgi:ligand-binding SRPBCC domain-containing protein
LAHDVPDMARENLFVYTSRIEASAERVFRWHAEPGALERLTPPWEKVEVVEPAPGIRNGDRGILRVHLGPIPMLWKFEHSDYLEGRQFRDVQTAGPFHRWEHTHLFIPDGANACRLEDCIKYELPFSSLGNLLGGWMIRAKLKRTFEYRHRVTAAAMCASAYKWRIIATST